MLARSARQAEHVNWIFLPLNNLHELYVIILRKSSVGTWQAGLPSRHGSLS